MKEQTKIRRKPGKWLLWVVGVTAAVLLAAAVFVVQTRREQKPEEETVTVSTLEKIVHVSELSTFTAVYNGVAEVKNEKKPEQTDYYVSYEARVNAGIDFQQVAVSIDPNEKVVTLDMPEAHITDVNVDIASMDFIFLNDKANTAAVTQTAYKACETDVERESEAQREILELARQNAENVLTALASPLLEQMDAQYTLVIE